MKNKNIAIIGSGLIGTLLSIYLIKKGHKVTVFERREDIRKKGFSGRSINLALSYRGIKTLKKIGIDSEILKLSMPMNYRVIHEEKNTLKQNYGLKNEAIYSISRISLNKKMIDLAEKYGVTFIFNSKVWDINLPTAEVVLNSEDNDKNHVLKFDHIFGADGAFSKVRYKMQRKSRYDYSQKFLKIGYKELTIPAKNDGTHPLDKNGLHIWPRKKHMLIALPNLDGSFTATLFLPFEGENSFESIDSRKKIKLFFEENFPDLNEITESLIKNYQDNPVSALLTIKCFPWSYWDKVAVIGDAAHAMLPFYGQGMNAGFEDVFVLYQNLERYPENWELAFKNYEKERKPNTDAISEFSFLNYDEMSNKTADPHFILQKQIETYFSLKYPNQWKHKYSLISFSDTPYKEIMDIHSKQEQVMKEILSIDNIETVYKEDWVGEKMLTLMKD